MINENLILPISILLDERRFTYQERMFVYFWASRSLSHDFNFSLSQYASFRGFPIHSCSTNLRSILKRLKSRNFLTYSIKKDDIFVHFDESFILDSKGKSVYITKEEINGLSSVVTLRLFEFVCCICQDSCSIKLSIDALRKYLGIEQNMYGTNYAFFSRIIKPSIENISRLTRITLDAEFDGDQVILYSISLI